MLNTNELTNRTDQGFKSKMVTRRNEGSPKTLLLGELRLGLQVLAVAVHGGNDLVVKLQRKTKTSFSNFQRLQQASRETRGEPAHQRP